MWQDKLKEIINILENSSVNEIEIKFWGKTYRVVKNPSNNSAKQYDNNPGSHTQLESEKLEVKNDSLIEQDTLEIKSPMPGVFYSSKSPEASPFVNEGDTVKSGQVICIIESMKIMNEIESDFDGKIKNILVNNSDPVEYNQVLFIIEPL